MSDILTTTVFEKNAVAYTNDQRFRIIANKGSARSSKTWSIMQLLYYIALANKDNDFVISIIGMTMPQLKLGVIRDFKTMLGDEFNERCYNKSDFTYKIGRAIIEFFSADNEGKVKGPARNILWINEANHVPYPIYKQLATRTSEVIFIDYNPVSSFWFDKYILPREKGVRVIHSTYKDNNYLSQAIIDELESYKPIYDIDGNLVSGDEEFWKVYGLGLTGGRNGCCIKNWSIVENMPEYPILERLGMDFGFNDPTTLIDVQIAEVPFSYKNKNGELIKGFRNEIFLDELLYKSSMTISDVIDHLENNLDRSYLGLLICADQARPDSIEEIKRSGFNIKGVGKGNESIVRGIDILNRYHINVTSRSTNVIRELENYRWKLDRNGEQMGIPDKGMHVDHAIDGVRYVALEDLDIKYLETKQRMVSSWR